MTLLIIYVMLALGVSFACSVLEAVLLSITPSFVALAEKEGNPIAPALRRFKDDIDRPLVAILTLNTVAHTVGAAGAGAQAAVVWGDAWLGVFSGVLTLLILVVSEIIPKTLGAAYWRRLAGIVVRVLRGVIWAIYPLVVAMELLTKLISGGKKKHVISRAEMGALADIAAEQGGIQEGELRILRNLFRSASLTVKDVMTPRTVVFGLPKDASIGDVVEEHGEMRFSRVPLYGDNLDDVHGYILKDQLLLAAARGNTDAAIGTLERPLTLLPVTAPLSKAFDKMIDSREHIALVVDEYGGTAGIVTMEDIVETLLGLEIVDELDSVEDMQAYARRAWEARARKLGLVEPKAPDVSDETEDRPAVPTAE